MTQAAVENAQVHEPPTTREGWAAFVNETPSTATLLPADQWRKLRGDKRDAYDESRLAHHARLVVVATPAVTQIVNAGRRLTLLNRHQMISARRGLVITGDAGTGKTTAITQLGKHHEIQARHKRLGPGPFLPVVYVTVPPAASAKVLAAEFARFLGLPLPRSLNQVNITNAVCDVLCELGTDLVLVDEIHNISLATRVGAEASDQLKYLAERIPASFVYAGIDVENVGLFSGIRGRQIASRFASIATSSFAYGTNSQREQWMALVATLEQALLLHHHRQGSLLNLAEFLHERSGGMIGSLSHLVREAAIEAILDGTEKITKQALNRITLDHAAEHLGGWTKPHRRTPAQHKPKTPAAQAI